MTKIKVYYIDGSFDEFVVKEYFLSNLELYYMAVLENDGYGKERGVSIPTSQIRKVVETEI